MRALCRNQFPDTVVGGGPRVCQPLRRRNSFDYRGALASRMLHVVTCFHVPKICDICILGAFSVIHQLGAMTRRNTSLPIKKCCFKSESTSLQAWKSNFFRLVWTSYRKHVTSGLETNLSTGSDVMADTRHLKLGNSIF